jgi:hypothetical protein
MENLEKITKDVPPTFLESKESEKIITASDVSAILKKNLTGDELSNFLRGISYIGLKKSNSKQIIKNIIDSFIETYKLIETDDNKSRLVNSKIKMSLQKQSEHLIDQLTLCDDNKDLMYFMLGMIIQSLVNRN